VKLREIGEFGLIARIKKSWPASSPQVFKAIGDDAVVTSLLPGNDLVSTVDLLIEDVHFELSWISPFQLGRKALAKEWPCGATRIGKIDPLPHGVVVQDEKGAVDPAELKGYDHFA